MFNIGAEGQLYMGALGAVVVGYTVGGLPIWIHLPLALAVGALGGALWGAVPGILKARFGAHEVINTIMMNYIAMKLVDYLVKHVLRDPTASMDRTPSILSTAALPHLFGADMRLHAGLLIALAAVVLAAWLLDKTTLGFEIRTVGINPSAAQYAGMQVARTLVCTMALSGMLAGLAGAVEILGLYHTLPATFSTGYGFDAIAIALLARSRPFAVLPGSPPMGGTPQWRRTDASAHGCLHRLDQCHPGPGHHGPGHRPPCAHPATPAHGRRIGRTLCHVTSMD